MSQPILKLVKPRGIYLDRSEYDRVSQVARYIGGGAFIITPDTLASYIARVKPELVESCEGPKCVERVRGVLDQVLEGLGKLGLQHTEGVPARLAEAAAKKLVKARVIEVMDMGDGTALLFLPPTVSFEEARELAEKIGNTPYYVSTKDGLVERVLKLVRWDRDRRAYRVYYGLLRRVAEWALKKRLLLAPHPEKPFKYPRGSLKLDPQRVKAILSKLRPFQKSALEAWLKNEAFGTIVIPTGGGKTWVGIAAIARLGVPTLILVPTEELIRQWSQRIRELLGVTPGELGGGKKDIKPITVATYQSAYKYIDLIRDKFLLHIYDEGHRAPADTFKEIALQSKAPYRLVLTATPEREDRNHKLLYRVLGPPVYRVGYKTIMRQGYIVPIEHNVVYVDLTPEERKEYKKHVYGDNITKALSIAYGAKAKLPALAKILEKHRNNKILVFSERLSQAKEAYKVGAQVLGEDKVGLITGSTSPKERKRLFEDFKKGKIRAIFTTNVLDEGVDVPNADVAIILSGTGSSRQMIQRVGRVVRAAAGKKKAYVYEIVAGDTIEEKLSAKRRIGIGEIIAVDLASAYSKSGRPSKSLLEHAYKLLGGKEKVAAILSKKTKLKLTKSDIKILRKLHKARPSRARKLDEARRARTPAKIITWVKHPDRYDIPGVDTPDVARRRKSRAVKARQQIERRKKAKIDKCEVRETRSGRYAVVCWHDGKPVMHGAYSTKGMAEAVARRLKHGRVGDALSRLKE